MVSFESLFKDLSKATRFLNRNYPSDKVFPAILNLDPPQGWALTLLCSFANVFIVDFVNIKIKYIFIRIHRQLSDMGDVMKFHSMWQNCLGIKPFSLESQSRNRFGGSGNSDHLLELSLQSQLPDI